MNPSLRRLLIASLLASAASCGIGPGYVPQVRYFEPVLPVSADSGAASSADITLRMLPAEAANHLREPIIWRTDGVEFGKHEELSWTEPPSHYVDRAIFDEMFNRRGYQLFATGNHPLLRTIVWSFDEVRQPRHEVLIELYIGLELSKNSRVHLALIEARADVEGTDGADIAKAMGKALADLARQTANWVESNWSVP